MERFREKEVALPKTKAYARGKSYIQAMQKVIIPGMVLLQISSYQEKESLMLKLYSILSSTSEFSMYHLVVCIKEASKIMKTSMGHMANVSIVEEDTSEYIQVLATAEFIFSNENLPTYFVRREGQSLILVPGRGEEYRMSLLLNATCLVSFSEAYTRLVYKEHYRLEGIYKGQVAEPMIRASLKEYAFCLIQSFMMREQCGAVLCKYLSGRMKRILVVMDVEQGERMELENQISLLQGLDESCEIVVLLTAFNEGAKQELERMLPNAHIIMKQGKVSYTDAGYIRLERMRYLFTHCENINAVFEGRPEQEIVMEWHRLIGAMTFDQAYLISPHTVFWYAMFFDVPSLKVGVFPNKSQLLCLNGEKAERIYDSNTRSILCMFDKIVAFQNDRKQSLRQEKGMPMEKLCLIDPEYCTVRKETPVETVMINGVSYYEWGFMQKAIHNYEATYFLAAQREEKSILVYVKDVQSSAMESFFTLIERITKEEGIYIYIAVPYESMHEVSTQLELGKDYLDTAIILYEYLLTEEVAGLMDVLCVVGKESRKVRYLSQRTKKPCIRLEELKDVETFMEYLHGEEVDTLKDAPSMTEEEYLCCRNREIMKLLI